MHVNKEKQESLEKRMEKLEIFERDLIEKFILGSGKGGQKVNKTSSCVYIKHIPTKIEIKCQKDRSREMNRYFARKELCNRLEQIIFKEKSEKLKQQEKIRQQKKRRSRRLQQKILDEKGKHSKTKVLRQKPTSGEIDN